MEYDLKLDNEIKTEIRGLMNKIESWSKCTGIFRIRVTDSEAGNPQVGQGGGYKNVIYIIYYCTVGSEYLYQTYVPGGKIYESISRYVQMNERNDKITEVIGV